MVRSVPSGAPRSVRRSVEVDELGRSSFLLLDREYVAVRAGQCHPDRPEHLHLSGRDARRRERGESGSRWGSGSMRSEISSTPNARGRSRDGDAHRTLFRPRRTHQAVTRSVPGAGRVSAALPGKSTETGARTPRSRDGGLLTRAAVSAVRAFVPRRVPSRPASPRGTPRGPRARLRVRRPSPSCRRTARAAPWPRAGRR